MKPIQLSLFLTFLLLSSYLNGQNSIKIMDATISHENSKRACLQLNLDPEPKTLKEAWRDFLKDNYGFKLKEIGFLSNNDLLEAGEVSIKELSNETVDFYTHIVEDNNGSEMKVFLRYGYNIYLSKESNPNDYRTLNRIINEFLKFYLPKYYSSRVDDTEKRIKRLAEEAKDFEKEINKDSDEIKKLKKEIKELEDDLKENSELLKEAKTKLKKRKEKLERIEKDLNKL